MSKLGNKQRRFVKCQAMLVTWAYANGYELTQGDGYRDPRAFGEMGTKKAYGRKSSNHKIRLAVDFNLFKNGKYLKKTSDHSPLGAYWETLDPDATWGGHFNDGNHYSFIHNGRR